MSQKKPILMTPGPVGVRASVLKSLSKSIIFHRYSDFEELHSRLSSQLLRVFRASREHKCVIVTGSGTAANETVLSSAFDKHDKVLVVSNGDFGERLATILELHRVPVISYSVKAFHRIDPLEVLAKARNGRVTAIAMVAMETSTGMVNPVKQVGLLIQSQTRGRIDYFVDAVSALGCDPIDTKGWGITYCTSVPNKALEAPPGISFACVNTSKYFRRKKVPNSYYFDLSRYLRFGNISQTPTTPAVSQMVALSTALDTLSLETVRSRRARYQSLTDHLIEGLGRFGFVASVRRESDRSAAVTAFDIPKHIDGLKLNHFLRQEGFTLWFPPNSTFANRREIMLTSVMGNVTKSNVRSLVIAIERFVNAS